MIIERQSVVDAPAEQVWARVITPEGINDELRPWLTMSMPRGATDLTVDTVPIGTPVGRCWMRLFGVLPFDYDYLTIAGLDPGRGFDEQSTMLSMSSWRHQRTVEPGWRRENRCARSPHVHTPRPAAAADTRRRSGHPRAVQPPAPSAAEALRERLIQLAAIAEDVMYGYASRISFNRRRSLVLARLIAIAIMGAATPPNPDGSPRLRSVIRVAPGPASSHS